jgi:hypothetical protein
MCILKSFDPIFGLIGVIIGWGLTVVARRWEEAWFGAKLAIEGGKAPGRKGETADKVYMRFRVRNTTERRIAKHCRAYIVELHKISNDKVISENLLVDSFQLPWAGYDFEPRDIPAKVAQYVNIVSFSKHDSGWEFLTKPDFYQSLAPLKAHRGTYRVGVVVAGDGATPQTKQFNIDYNGDYKSAELYDT